jgi:hypothetical protein
MTRNLKALGLALLAVFAMSAVAASGASAAEDVFTSSEEVTDLTGHGAGAVFQYTEGKLGVTCETETYNGTIEGAAVNEITVHPVYEGHCTAGPFEATITTDGCNYIISGDTDENGHAGVEIECDEGKEITVDTACTIHIPPQTPTGGGVSFANGVSGQDDVTVNATVTGIHSTVTHSFACTLGGIAPGTHTGGTYEGSVTVKGYKHESAHEAADQVDISVDTR